MQDGGPNRALELVLIDSFDAAGPVSGLSRPWKQGTRGNLRMIESAGRLQIWRLEEVRRAGSGRVGSSGRFYPFDGGAVSLGDWPEIPGSGPEQPVFQGDSRPAAASAVKEDSPEEE